MAAATVKPEVPKKTEVSGFGERIKNALRNNYRGLIGALVPLLALTWQVERFNTSLKLELIWMWMFWFSLFQPVAVPCVGLIPVFAFPMGGIMSTDATCLCYMNDTIIFYIIGSMLLLLLNNSGFDRRVAVWFLCSGEGSNFSASQLVYRSSMASFFLSMFSSRLITGATLTQMITNGFDSLPEDKESSNLNDIRHIINNAVQTSASIGGLAIFHSAYATIAFRGAFEVFASTTSQFPDIFNFLQYSAFAFPVAATMFVLNLAYHTKLVRSKDGENPMSGIQVAALRSNLIRNKEELPEISLHEKLTVFFATLILLLHLFRFSLWIPGWATFSVMEGYPTIPKLKDATTCAIFLILLNIIPKGYGFIDIFSAKKKSDLPPLKPESPILWWRFVDKNINYGYMFTIGSCYAIIKAARLTGLNATIGANLGLQITTLSWGVGLLICIVIASILCNVMSSMAALAMWLPFVMCMSTDAPFPWPRDFYLAALGVGMACSLGFCCPFQYTPAYYCHTIGKVPILRMTKLSYPAVLICTIVLYLALLFYAPILWGSSTYLAPTTTTTTTAAPP